MAGRVVRTLDVFPLVAGGLADQEVHETVLSRRSPQALPWLKRSGFVRKSM
jgi:hypothetical protein